MTLLIGPVCEMAIESARIATFYAAHWRRRIALLEDQFYDWQFKSLPTAPGKDHCIIAYDSDKDVIAGVMGLNERPFHLKGHRMRGAELTSWIVTDSYRNKGIGGKIVARIQATYDVVIGMGVSELAMPLYLRSGFRYLAAIPRFVRVFNYDAVSRVGTSERLADQLARQWLTPPSISYTAIEHSGADADPLFARIGGRYNLSARDAAHLSWRYALHPTFNYRAFLVRPKSGGGEAFVAFRKESAVPNLTICHILDCIGDDEAMEAAFSYIDDLCRQEGADVADFYCTSSRINKYPLARGWFSTLDDKCLVFPHLFHPLEIRTPATTSLIYWAKHDFLDMCDFSKLYVTKQDADLDRPTLESP